MSGMADVIAAHQSIWECMGFEDDRTWLECSCRSFSDDDWTGDLDAAHAAHVAVELTEAGFGSVQEALLAAADEMPIETLLGADEASVWPRERVHAADTVAPAAVRRYTVEVTATTAAGFEFRGCSDLNPDNCACNTWAEVICQLCDEPISDGQQIQTVTYPTIHSVDYDNMDQEWETDVWHTHCTDPLAAAMQDQEGRALVQAIHDRKAEG